MKAFLIHACFTYIFLLAPIASAAGPVIVPDPEIQEQIEAAKDLLLPGFDGPVDPSVEPVSLKDIARVLKEDNKERLGVLVEQMIYNIVNFSSDERSGYATMVLIYSLKIDPVVVLQAAVPLLDSTQKWIAHETKDHVLGNLFAVEDGYGENFDPLKRYLAEGGELTPSLAVFVLRYSGTGAFEAIAAEYVDEGEREALVARVAALPELVRSARQSGMLTHRQRETFESLCDDQRWWVRLYVPLTIKRWLGRDSGIFRPFFERLATDPEPAVREAALYYLPRGWEP